MSINSSNNSNENDKLINELIINSVRLRSSLWDLNNKFYKDNAYKKKLWAEIAYELKVNEDFLKTRWRTLRDRYFRENKKLITRSGQAATKTSIWSLWESMTFLKHVSQPRQTITNISYETEKIIQPTMPKETNYNESFASQEILEITNVDVPNNLCQSADKELSKLESQSSSSQSYSSNSLQKEVNSTIEKNLFGKRSLVKTAPSSFKKSKANQKYDPVEEVILDYVKNKPSARSSSNDEYSSEEYFYLSIARDVQNCSLLSRLRMRQKVLYALEEILENENIN